MHLGGDWVDTKRQSWKAGGCVPEEAKREVAALTSDNYDCGRQSQCHWSFPRRTCPSDRQSCVLLNIVFVIGRRQAVNVSSCTNNNVYLNKANGMQRGQKSGRAAPGPIFGRAFRQTLIGATFPNRNSVSLKS